MKKLGLLSILAFVLIFLAGCTNKIVETGEIADEENIVEAENQENIEEEIVEEEVEEEIIDGEKWNLLAFNGKEVDGNYRMIIKDNGEISVKFCNSIGGNISFDGDDEGTISATLVQTEMACEGESMDLENAFKIDGATYSIMADEDGGSTMIIKTEAGNKFIWRMLVN